MPLRIFAMGIAGLVLLGLAGCRFAPWPEDVPQDVEEPAGGKAVYGLIPEVEIIRSAGPADLSSITHVSNQVYLAASDSNGTICEVVVQRGNRPNALPRFSVRRTFVLEGGKDIEGRTGWSCGPATSRRWRATATSAGRKRGRWCG